MNIYNLSEHMGHKKSSPKRKLYTTKYFISKMRETEKKTETQTHRHTDTHTLTHTHQEGGEFKLVD